MWREERADRLEAQVLTDLFAAGRLPDPAEADAAKATAFKSLSTLLRYRGRIEREHRAAMQALGSPRQRRLAAPSRAATKRTRTEPCPRPPPVPAAAAAVPPLPPTQRRPPPRERTLSCWSVA